MKALTTTLQQVLEDRRVRLLGNVELGTDVSVSELRASYDAVVYATGAPGERRLGIPGEDLAGSLSAGDVVGWYSGHPDSVRAVPLDSRAAVVVGAGNVALDIVRVLCKDPAELSTTDIPIGVLQALAGSAIRDVHLLCRRGPADTRFTSKELRELGELEGVDVVVDPGDLVPGDGGESPPAIARNLALLREWAARAPSGASRRMHLHFWSQPVAVTGSTSVDGVIVERTTSAGPNLLGTGLVRRLAAGLVIRSVGFTGAPVPGVPWDPEKRVIPHVDGRVLRAGEVSPDEYVAGWCARGARGVLGANRPDADRVVEHLQCVLPCRPERPDLLERLVARDVEVVQLEGWEAIDRCERLRGQQQGREREKLSEWATLLRIASTDAGAVA